MSAFYNEIEPYAADWLTSLADSKRIAEGVVERRSIVDLKPTDVAKYTQAHFFAGIGGWSHALRLAGWPDDRPVWTGSCPCQPFSSAGRGRGFADERHLWPIFFNLIRECRPPIIFGEQVASPAGLEWLDAVFTDLEGADYAVGAADLCAAGVGAPHIRQRLYFVAIASSERREGLGLRVQPGRSQSTSVETGRGGEVGDVVDAEGTRGCGGPALEDWRHSQSRGSSTAGELGDAGRERGRRDAGAVPSAQGEGASERGGTGCVADESQPTSTTNFWSPCDWIPCRDGKTRPVEPDTFPLAHGVPGRVGRLRGYGNAIVPPLATEFIKAAMDVLS